MSPLVLIAALASAIPMLAQDGLQRYLMDVGPWARPRQRFLVLPPGFKGPVPSGYFVSRLPTYSVAFAVRASRSEGRPIRRSR